MEKLSLRVHRLRASLPYGNVDEIEKEIISLKDEHGNLSAIVFAQQEITSCINLLATQIDCLTPTLTLGLSTKAALLNNSFSEIRRVVQSCETELIFRKAEDFVGLKYYQEALRQCESILTLAPWHEGTRNLLNVIARTNVPLKTKKQAILQKFQFHYLHSFGQGILSQPHDLHVSQDGTTLFVSDQGDNSVHRFSIIGEYLGRCSISPTKPRGIFSDRNNKIWVCDIEGQRLIGMNLQGEQQTEIYLPNHFEKGCTTTYPCWGTHTNGTTSLILTDHQEQLFVQRNFFVQDIGQNWGAPSLKEIDVPCGIVLHRNTIWVGSRTQGCLYIASKTGKQLKHLKAALPLQLKAFTIVKNEIFLNFGNTLVKTTISGEVIFSVDLAIYFGRLLDLNFGLAVAEENGREILFAPDRYNKCIHAFSV